MDKQKQNGHKKPQTTCLFEDGNVHVHNEASFQKVREHLEHFEHQTTTEK